MTEVEQLRAQLEEARAEIQRLRAELDVQEVAPDLSFPVPSWQNTEDPPPEYEGFPELPTPPSSPEPTPTPTPPSDIPSPPHTPPPDLPPLVFSGIDDPARPHRDVNDFLADVVRLGSDEHLHALLDQLRQCGPAVSFRNLSNDARRRLLQPDMLPATFQHMVQDATAGNEVFYVRVAADGQWKTVAKRLTPEEFDNWTRRTFLENDRFVVQALCTD